MTAKELKIREVYGDKYDQCQPNENGWTYYHVMYPQHVGLRGDDTDIASNANGTLWRPKELAGIEHNYGWNRIDEVGLPKESGNYKWICKYDGRVYEIYFRRGKRAVSLIEGYTHWKPIEPEVMPVY